METKVRISGEVMSKSAIRNLMVGYISNKVVNGDIILVFRTKDIATANIMAAWASLSEKYGDDITTVSDSGDCMSFDAAQAKII